MGPLRYTYAQVTAADRDVFIFLAHHPEALQLDALPKIAWVARDEGRIVALLLCRTQPQLTLDLIVPPPGAPFVAIYRLWGLAEEWLTAQGVKAYVIAVEDRLAHYQRVLEHAGFERLEDDLDDTGHRRGQVYIRRLPIAPVSGEGGRAHPRPAGVVVSTGNGRARGGLSALGGQRGTDGATRH